MVGATKAFLKNKSIAFTDDIQVKFISDVPIDIVTNTAYPIPYFGIIKTDVSAALGFNGMWFTILYMPYAKNPYINGYGTQIISEINHINKIYTRCAVWNYTTNINEWLSWNQLYPPVYS